MRTPSKPLLAVAGLAATLSFAGCTAPTPSVTPPPPPTEQSVPAEPVDPGTAPATDAGTPTGTPPGVESTSEGFEGEVASETITVNQMQVQVPKGIKLPDTTLVTKSEPNNLMMADESEAAVVEAVTSSAKAAGYTVHAEGEAGTVFVGNGNAVLLTAGPKFQILTWGPESMKDVLAGTP